MALRAATVHENDAPQPGWTVEKATDCLRCLQGLRPDPSPMPPVKQNRQIWNRTLIQSRARSGFRACWQRVSGGIRNRLSGRRGLPRQRVWFYFRVKIKTENRDAVYKRFQEIGNGEVEGVKLLGIWHSLTQDENWSILESSDAIQIAGLFHKWTDLALNDLTSVVDNDDMYKVLTSK
jgi:hypothetical protein